jgi:metal-sulfur cluster biosynthetic enzyme
VRAIRGGADDVPPVTPAQVTEALRGVIDPELGLSVVELGLIYAVTVDDGRVRVRMTLTAPGCPLHTVMPDWVREAVRGIPGVQDAEVELTFDPPWTPDRMARSAS